MSQYGRSRLGGGLFLVLVLTALIVPAPARGEGEGRIRGGGGGGGGGSTGRGEKELPIESSNSMLVLEEGPGAHISRASKRSMPPGSNPLNNHDLALLLGSRRSHFTSPHQTFNLDPAALQQLDWSKPNQVLSTLADTDRSRSEPEARDPLTPEKQAALYYILWNILSSELKNFLQWKNLKKPSLLKKSTGKREPKQGGDFWLRSRRVLSLMLSGQDQDQDPEPCQPTPQNACGYPELSDPDMARYRRSDKGEEDSLPPEFWLRSRRSILEDEATPSEFWLRSRKSDDQPLFWLRSRRSDQPNFWLRSRRSGLDMTIPLQYWVHSRQTKKDANTIPPEFWLRSRRSQRVSDEDLFKGLDKTQPMRNIDNTYGQSNQLGYNTWLDNGPLIHEKPRSGLKSQLNTGSWEQNIPQDQIGQSFLGTVVEMKTSDGHTKPTHHHSPTMGHKGGAAAGQLVRTDWINEANLKDSLRRGFSFHHLADLDRGPRTSRQDYPSIIIDPMKLQNTKR